MNKIYLDYAATTPLNSEVLETILPYLKEKFGNASSIHSFGRETRVAVEDSRELISGYLGCAPGEVFFTSGGTESINFALAGMANYLWRIKKTRILSSVLEHHATLATLEFLSKIGFETVLLKPDKNGLISRDIIAQNYTENTGMISLMYVNNETGHFNDISSIGEFCKEKNIIFHVDAVQGFGKFPIEPAKFNIDIMSASAHKIYGPKGTGLIFIKSGTDISQIIFGGSQERKRRGGTENVPGIVGFGKAVKIISDSHQQYFKHVNSLKNITIDFLSLNFGDKIVINSLPDYTSPYILNFSLDPEIFSITADSLLMLLDLKGIAVSTGSACTSGVPEPSHVIMGLGKDEKWARNSIRFSFSHLTTEDELNFALSELKIILSNAEKSK